MWKNIFWESCLLSALIFGGFWINSNFLKQQIDTSDQKIQHDQSHALPPSSHISGNLTHEVQKKETTQHISGHKNETHTNSRKDHPIGIGGIR